MLRKLLVVVSLLALVLPAGALAAPRQQAAAGEYAIVTLADAPIATYEGGKPGLERTKPLRGRLDPASPAYRAYERFLASERANYRAFLAQRVPGVEVIAEYDTVLNGLAVKLNGANLNALANHPKVKSVGASWLYRPSMNISVDVIKAPAVWTALGGQEGAGSGIDVGIIDTGIREDHPFFACKDEIPHKTYAAGVAGTGEDIVFNHGTHVAGTVAGCVIDLPGDGLESEITGTISGVAPGANLHDYNVFPGYGGGFVAFDGSAFSHDIALAVEDAVNDGMDVINLSLGGSIQGEHDYLAEAINAAAAAGVVPAVAAGNTGPNPSTMESPGNAFGALTAGATTNPHFIGITVSVEGGDTIGAALGDFENFDPPVTADYTVTEPADGCTAITNDVEDKIALIDRGTCDFTTKVRNAENAGAAGVLVVNNVAGDPTAMAHNGTTPDPVIPAAMVGKVEGEEMKPSGTVTVDGTDPKEIVTQNVDIIAGFSSRGPSNFTENIKPDVTAPGVNVYSSVFDEATGELGWALFNGTSMATPHVAGAAALLLDANPDLTPADVKSLLGNNADRTVTDHVNGTDDPGVMARGGGRINLERASAATTTFDPMSLSFGISNGNRPVNETITVTVTNLSQTAKTLAISGGTDAMEYPDSVEVGPGGEATFEVSLSTRGPAEAEGDLTVTDGTETFLVPYWYSNGN